MKLHHGRSQTVVTIGLLARWRKQEGLDKTDFKSAVSTNFTIGALRRSVTGQRKLLMPANCSTNEKGKRYRFPFF